MEKNLKPCKDARDFPRPHPLRPALRVSWIFAGKGGNHCTHVTVVAFSMPKASCQQLITDIWKGRKSYFSLVSEGIPKRTKVCSKTACWICLWGNQTKWSFCVNLIKSRVGIDLLTCSRRDHCQMRNPLRKAASQGDKTCVKCHGSRKCPWQEFISTAAKEEKTCLGSMCWFWWSSPWRHLSCKKKHPQSFESFSCTCFSRST